MRSGIFFWMVLVSTSLLGQGISSRKIKRQLAKTEAFQKAHVALQVTPLGADKPVAHFQSERYMTPASNVKLLTFLAAQQAFDRLPALFYRQKGDSLIQFKSSGYPLLLHPFYADSSLTAFFNKEVAWDYVVNAPAPQPFGPGWSWDDFSYYYAAPKSKFPIYGNSVQVTYNGDTFKAVPDLSPLQQVTDSLTPKLLRDQFRNRFTLNPLRWTANDTLYRPFIPSDSLFVVLLAKAIQKPISLQMSPTDNLPWEPLYTNAEETLYKGLLQDSDNGIAEALLLMIAQKAKGQYQTQQAIDTFLTQWNKWLPDKVEWVDGSGVSRYNMVTPRTLVEVLQRIHQKIGWQEIKKLFPQGGVSGTLKAYEVPHLYAKTGSLRHNHNLSGYFQNKKGKIFVFSVMVNHFTAPTADVKKGISEVLIWLQQKLR